MRYHYIPPQIYLAMYGSVYHCDHPVYSSCTLYLVDDLGLAVIQQRYRPEDKSTYWTEIDAALVDILFMSEGFMDYFYKKAGPKKPNGCYPTVTIRQLMWAIRLKPLHRETWETVFDKSPI